MINATITMPSLVSDCKAPLQGYNNNACMFRITATITVPSWNNYIV